MPKKLFTQAKVAAVGHPIPEVGKGFKKVDTFFAEVLVAQNFIGRVLIVGHIEG